MAGPPPFLGSTAPKKCRSGGKVLAVFDLPGPEIELQFSRTDVFHHYADRSVLVAVRMPVEES